MRALSITAPGRAEIVDVPPPAAPGPGEVLLRVAYVGLCGTDLATFKGANPLVSYPRVIGHEVSATIEAAGAGVPPEYAAGTRVAVSPYQNCGRCAACRAGRPNACRDNSTLGVQREGAAAEQVVAPVNRLFPSRSLPLDCLALVEPFSIGMHAVRRARLAAGETVLVIGCGGVGIGAVSAAASRGGRVIAMDVDPAKLQLAAWFGAADAVDARDPAAAADHVRSLTGGDGPAVVIEAAGQADAYRTALDLVAPCGRIVCIGWVKGDAAFEARHLVAKEVEMLGSRNATDELAEVIRIFESGRVNPLAAVTHRVSLDEAPRILAEWAERPSAVGKILVSV